MGSVVRQALRSLVRAPSFTLLCSLTLALGLGSTVAFLAVLRGVLFAPLPYQDPDRLVAVWHTAPGMGYEVLNQSPALHFYYSDEVSSFAAVGMWDNTVATVTGLAEPVEMSAVAVTHETLPLLGVTPQLGRFFSSIDDSPAGSETILVSHEFWQTSLSGSSDIVGRQITVNGRNREVIGVLPEEFDFLGQDADLFLPFRLSRSQVAVGDFSYQGVARLSSQANISRANEEVAALLPQAAAAFPGGMTTDDMVSAGLTPRIIPLREEVVGDASALLWPLLGAAVVILLIAIANVANLLLVRAERREHEMAVRRAIGSGRARLLAQVQTENFALTLLSGILGFGLAWGMVRTLVILGPESLPRISNLGLNQADVITTTALCVVVALILGVFSTLRLRYLNPGSSLRAGGRQSGSGSDRHLLRRSLVVVQMAFAVVLLAGSGLMLRSFQELAQVDPGFAHPEQVVTFRVNIPPSEVLNPNAVAITHREIRSGLSTLPGVVSVGMASSATMDGWDSNGRLETSGAGARGRTGSATRRFKFAAPGYFSTMGNPVVAGRDIEWEDIDGAARVVVVSESLARAEWGSVRAALGGKVRQVGEGILGEWYDVIGVVGDVRDDGLSRPPVPIVYWPQVTEGFWGAAGAFTPRSMAYVLRFEGRSAGAVLAASREVVWGVNPNLPLSRASTLGELVARSTARTSFALVLLGVGAGLSLLLGLIGIYGVLSYVVSQRTREIAIRMALGARGRVVGASVVREAALLAAAGAVLGLVLATLVRDVIAALLFGVGPLDPITLASVVTVLFGVAVVASWLPARRAATLPPAAALRS